MIRAVWAGSSRGGQLSIVVLVALMAFQLYRGIVAAIAGDWWQVPDIVSIFVMAWVTLTWVRIASIERGR